MGAGLADAGKREETAAKRLRSTKWVSGRGYMHSFICRGQLYPMLYDTFLELFCDRAQFIKSLFVTPMSFFCGRVQFAESCALCTNAFKRRILYRNRKKIIPIPFAPRILKERVNGFGHFSLTEVYRHVVFV